ncbi:hypothetical protein FS749_011152 [Ceratobasidium sp. UAMH 11750]|nr:hypothetical protein FS749_011152 [Ceratobasidium sp. UAMH 11750]
MVRVPWPANDNYLLDCAINFAKKYTKDPVDDMVTEDFRRTIMRGSSQLRSAAQNPIRAMAQSFYHVTEGDVQMLSWLQKDDRFLYPAGHIESGDIFNTSLIGSVLATLYFGTSRRLGFIFLDELLEDDNAEDVNQVLELAAEIGPEAEVEVPTIVDQSPAAKRGPSISAIAFACIHILHALERLKTPQDAEQADEKRKKRRGGVLKKEFNEEGYGETWRRYVRELAANPDLGKLRMKCLEAIQRQYCRSHRHQGKPAGADYMW